MIKKISFKVAIVFLAAGGLFLFQSCNKTTGNAKKTSLTNQRDSTEYLVYHIHYPDSPLFGGVADSMEHLANDAKNRFMQMQPSDTSEYHVTPYELLVQFKRFFHSPEYVSYVANIYSFTGGAHGRSIINTMNYDAKNKHFVTLKDLFRDTTALQPISKYARKRIVHKIYQKNSESDMDSLERKMLDSGTMPTVKNYQNFLIAGQSGQAATGLKIIFSPYQVGPHSIGIPKIFVPDSVFYHKLSPDYQSLFKND
jgi:hypothetical protein